MIESRKILIATPLFPPAIGGPSQYAKNLAEAWRANGHSVLVVDFGKVLHWPTGWRHLVYWWRVFKAARGVDFILILDTFSVALPAVLVAKILGKKAIIRTGGDFLWESYVERTGHLVLLRDFYNNFGVKFSLKERIVFAFTWLVLRLATVVVFSTDWQRQIFCRAYGLPEKKTRLVENYYGVKEASETPPEKIFIASTRPLKWKNRERLAKAFTLAKKTCPEIKLYEESLPYGGFIEQLKKAYAVILVSLGDISPNLILDAVRHDKPFILTTENGLENRLAGIGLRADPESIADMAAKIVELADWEKYQVVGGKIKAFNFTHSWREIGDEFLAINDQS